jgi:TRAP-type uncharacterized transport system substrate-binding protein
MLKKQICNVISLCCLITLSLHGIVKAEKIATGKIDGEYYKRGIEFCKDKSDCKVIETHGSAENVKLLLDGKVDYAILQENFVRKIEQKFTLSNGVKEYLHLIYNPELPVSSITDFYHLTTVTNQLEGENGLLYEIMKQPKTIEIHEDVKDALCFNEIDYKIYVRSSGNTAINFLIKSCKLEIFSIPDNVIDYPLENIEYNGKTYRVPVIKSFIVKLKDV